MAKKRTSKCAPTFEIRRAGHLLSTKGSSRAGRLLVTRGKNEKQKRLKKGCLNGPAGTFKLTAKQKRKLPKTLQRAILNHHRRLGKTIYD